MPRWVLGHIWWSDYSFLQLITGTPVPAWVDEGVKAVYGNKSEPSSDKTRYKPKQFYIEKLIAVREQIYTRLKAMTAADFDAPHPDPASGGNASPTVGPHGHLLWHMA